LLQICPRPPAASAEAARVTGLFLIILNGVYAGGPVFIKHHHGVRYAAAAVVFFVIFL